MRVLDVGVEKAPSYPRSEASVATRQDYERRAKDLAQLSGSRWSIASPTLKVFANQTGKMAIAEQISYIKDYEVEVLGDQKIADPVIGSLEDGFDVEITPLYDPDGGALVVAGKVTFSHVVKPIREHQLKIGESTVTVQLPEVVSNRWNGEVRLEPAADTFKITGLAYSPPGSEERRGVEVWCLLALAESVAAQPTGEIIDRDDKYGNVFVRFPLDAVPDDPWAKAPKEVSVFRRGEKIGTARLSGGWVIGTDARNPVIAIYRLAEGTPRDGDSVR
jgi:hypothetical protein